MQTRASSQQLLTVEAAASRLQLHPKTVLRCIRDGRLRATKIGKSYRIVLADLEAFAGTPVTEASPADEATVTAIVDVPGVSSELAQTLARKIPASLKGREPGGPPMRADVIYEEERSHLKIVLVGPPGDTSVVLGMIRLWLETVRA